VAKSDIKLPSTSPLRAWYDASQRRLAPLILLAPAVCLFALFVVYPLAENIRLSFYRWDGAGAARFVGLENYRLLLQDPVFFTALGNNLLWLISFGLAPVAGLGLALLVHQSVRGIRIVRSLFFMPFVISQVVVGLMFAWFFHTEFGLFASLLRWSPSAAAPLLESEYWPIVMAIIASLWPQISYCMILYLTGLSAVRRSLIEAARSDGAQGPRLLWSVVLPQLRPVSFIVSMVCVVSALRSFDIVMIMTGGGPYDSSTVLALYMYEQTFSSLRFGYGAAIATVLLLLMVAGVGPFLWHLLHREG
jgi:multiple sugar transport system permease protein